MIADKLIFALMIITALYIVSCRNYKRIIIALGAFSLLASFCYLLYHAPDVAVAEAVIGSALSTILYIVALKKHRAFYIFFTTADKDRISDYKMRSEVEDIVSKIMQYCANNDLEAQVVFSWQSPESIASEHLYDLILLKDKKKVTIYGLEADLHMHALKSLLSKTFSESRVNFKTIETDMFADT